MTFMISFVPDHLDLAPPGHDEKEDSDIQDGLARRNKIAIHYGGCAGGFERFQEYQQIVSIDLPRDSEHLIETRMIL